METFISAFLEICSEGDEVVDRNELLKYCAKKGLDKKLVDEWMTHYDTDQNGKISLEEFSRGTGIDAQDMRVQKYYRYSAKSKPAPKLADDIKVISSSMCQQHQVDITERYKELIKNIPDDEMNINNVVEKLKVYLDKQYKKSWHVIVVSGSYCMKFSHEPFLNLQFSHKKRAVIVWRTPST